MKHSPASGLTEFVRALPGRKEASADLRTANPQAAQNLSACTCKLITDIGLPQTTGTGGGRHHHGNTLYKTPRKRERLHRDRRVPTRLVIPDDMKGQFAAIYCDRRFGIGADGVIFLSKSAKERSQDAPPPAGRERGGDVREWHPLPCKVCVRCRGT